MTTWRNTAFEMRFRIIDGLTIRFAEGGSHRDHALLLGPWPESLLAFDAMWWELSGHTHLVAVDLPGFGHSQRREDLMSPRAMGEFLVTAADAFGLEQPHVIGPGFSTAATLFAAAGHPGRFRSLVVGGGATAVPLRLGGLLEEWVEAPDPELRREDPGRLVTAALSCINRYVLPDFVREDYLNAYRGDRMAESMRYTRAYAAELPGLRGLLPQIETPVQIIAGAHDEWVPPVNAEYLQQRLPNSKLDILDAGHFVWEDAAAEYATLVSQWWRSGNE